MHCVAPTGGHRSNAGWQDTAGTVVVTVHITVLMCVYPPQLFPPHVHVVSCSMTGGHPAAPLTPRVLESRQHSSRNNVVYARGTENEAFSLLYFEQLLVQETAPSAGEINKGIPAKKSEGYQVKKKNLTVHS